MEILILIIMGLFFTPIFIEIINECMKMQSRPMDGHPKWKEITRKRFERKYKQ